MCICPNNVKFQCEELSWPMALMERPPGAAGIWPADRFQGDISGGKHLMSPKSPFPWCAEALTVVRPLLPSLLAPGNSMVRKEDPDSAWCPLPDTLPSPLE